MALPPHYDDGHQTIQYDRRHHEEDCYSCSNTGVTTVTVSNVCEERRKELSIMAEKLEQAKKCIKNLMNCDLLDGTPSLIVQDMTLLGIRVLLAIAPGTPSDIEWAQRHLRGLIIDDNDRTQLERLNEAIALMEGSSRDQLVEWYYDTLDPRPTIDVVPGQNNSDTSPLSDPSGTNVAAAAPVMIVAEHTGHVAAAAAAAAADAGNHDDDGLAVMAGSGHAGLPSVAPARNAAEGGNHDDGGRNRAAADPPAAATGDNAVWQ